MLFSSKKPISSMLFNKEIYTTLKDILDMLVDNTITFEVSFLKLLEFD